MDLWHGFRDKFITTLSNAENPSDLLYFHVCLYRGLYLMYAMWHVNDFYQANRTWKLLSRGSIKCMLNLLLIWAAKGYGQMLEDRVNSLPMKNDGLVFVCFRFSVLFAMFLASMLGSFKLGGYKKGYTCDEKSCVVCELPKRKHPATWTLSCLEYQLMCMVLFYPMSYLMSSVLIAIDSTDIGSFLIGVPSLVNRTMNVTAAMS